MQRYRLNGAMTKINAGQWVKFEEVEAEIIRLKNKVKTLETTIKQQLSKKHSLSGDVK